MQSRIMFIDCKSSGLKGSARIGRVEFSQTGRTLYYRDRMFKPVQGYKYNYVDADTGAEYWISGCKKWGGDTLYGGVIAIDADVREEYWTVIRAQPQCKDRAMVKCLGKKHKQS